VRRAALLLVLISCAVFAANGAAHLQMRAAACETTEIRVHDEAVFGHFSTLAAAKRLRTHAAAFGFKGIKIENDGCGDFEVEIDGADRQADRTSFAAEAAKVGFQITFEQIAPPLQFHEGQVVGVFAHMKTVSAANALMWKLAAPDFRFIDLAREGTSWLIVMPQVPTKDALSIAREVATAGFQIQFRPGGK
jgi:hypothetical protein